MSAVVGIPQTLDVCGRWRPGRDYLYIDRAYAKAVEDAGGVPLHLPPQRDADTLADRIDALLVPGGDDFLPGPGSTYPTNVRFEPTAEDQLDFDRRLLAAALERDLPILGICYGMQLLSLHHGGRLHHHLPLDVPDAGPHQLPEADGRHPLRVESGTRLAGILGEDALPVNSLHHQAVAAAGEGMLVCATGPDGVIEAIESERARFAIGVQWHPEKLPGDERLPLFRALVDACEG